MKRRIIFLFAGLFLLAIAGNVIKAEGPNCGGCYTSPPWPGTSDYTVSVRGDCYSDWMLCGTVIICGSGMDQCQPWQCNTEFQGCTQTIPN
jgi:hypothetical protein